MCVHNICTENIPVCGLYNNHSIPEAPSVRVDCLFPQVAVRLHIDVLLSQFNPDYGHNLQVGDFPRTFI